MYEDILDLFVKRRSIRSYQDKPVEKEKLDTILKAAFAAPSTFDSCKFYVVFHEQLDYNNYNDLGGDHYAEY